MYSDLDCSYREQQNQMMKDWYSSSYSAKKLSFDDVVYKFEDAVRTRITFSYDNYSIEVKDYRHVPYIVEAFGILKSFRASSKYEKNSVAFLKEIITDEMYYWKTEDWCHYKNNGNYVLGKGFHYLDMFIQKYLLQTAKNLQIKNKKPSDNQTPSNDIKTSKTTIIEPKNEEPTKTVGRPLGSKNKKPAKETFMPSNIVKITDGKVDIDSLILAIADLVWRQPEKMDGFYLDLLNLNEGQRKYVNKLFMINSPLLQNSYWEIAQKGKTKVLIAKRKRAGYYSNKNYSLLSLAYISEKSGIAKMTLQDRLNKYSIKEAVSMQKYDRL